MPTKKQQLLDKVEAFAFEYDKFLRGNKTAGTRARKALMELKRLSGQFREEIQEQKNAMERVSNSNASADE